MSTGTPVWLPVFALFMLGATVLPGLTTSPWTAPDELHHLVVARNLADTGSYASGHPDAGLIPFDSYDSVGPSVLVPVALVMRVLDDDLLAARAVMASMFLAWASLSWLLIRPVFGGRAALAGVVLGATAIGSIYLGRTLYGEVPAMLYATAGLLYWRVALSRERHAVFSMLAGAGFGLAVLAKTFFVLSAFAVLAVYVFDRFSYRRIRLAQLLISATVAVAIVGLWLVLTIVYGTDQDDSFVMLYRHYLMFGFESVAASLSWFAERPATVVIGLLGAVSALPLLFLLRYDPPVNVLLLTAALFVYWWIFFTPGNIPRYLWYPLAILGLLTGPLWADTIRRSWLTRERSRSTMVAFALSVILVVPGANEYWFEIQRAWSADEMSDERALHDTVETLGPEGMTTTSWMAQRSANFFANAHIPLVTSEEAAAHSKNLVRDSFIEEWADGPGGEPMGTGRYILYPAAGNTATRNE